MKIIPVKTRVFREGDDLVAFIKKNVRRITERSILIVTSKIVALSERRTVVAKTEKDRERWIKKESQWAMRTKYAWLTIRDGMVMASAGIDESNAKGKLILLPCDSFKTAASLRKELRTFYNVKRLGVVITDSRLLPLRNGVVGVALGYAGFNGIRDYRGTPDLFGRKFQFSKTDVADSVATAAVLTMGEGRERQPLAVVNGAPVTFTERVNQRELEIDIKEDLYQPLFAKIKNLRNIK